MATERQDHPSQYLQAMTRFLTDMMDTTLHSLPNDIKGLIYFDALNHLASELIVSETKPSTAFNTYTSLMNSFPVYTKLQIYFQSFQTLHKSSFFYQD